MVPFMRTQCIFTKRISEGKISPENTGRVSTESIATGSAHDIEGKQ
jgi:hypothetical protein